MFKKYDSVPKKRLLWPKNLDGSQNSWGAQTEPFGFIPHLVESAVQQIRGILEYVVNSFSFACICGSFLLFWLRLCCARALSASSARRSRSAGGDGSCSLWPLFNPNPPNSHSYILRIPLSGSRRTLTLSFPAPTLEASHSPTAP